MYNPDLRYICLLLFASKPRRKEREKKRGKKEGEKRRREREEGKGRKKGGKQEGKERSGAGERREGKKRREGAEKEEKKSNAYSRSINKDSRRHSVFPRSAHCPEARQGVITHTFTLCHRIPYP